MTRNKKNTKLVESVSSILGTNEPNEQIRRLKEVISIAQVPVFCMTIYYDPRSESGPIVSFSGPDCPISVGRHMLSVANNLMNEAEVKEKLAAEKKAETTPEA